MGYIRRSCEAYDRGHKDEAIRIATALRVLMHDTRRSVSILEHLKVKGIMRLNSTCYPPPPGAMMFGGLVRFGMRVEQGQVSRWIEPVLDDEAHPHAVVPLQEWWEVPIYITSAGNPLPTGGVAVETKSIRRKDVILAAANQDGGAHVDAELDPDYARLSSPGGLGFMEGEATLPDGTKERMPPMEDAHLVLLRTMGYEVLVSQSLKMLLVLPDD